MTAKTGAHDHIRAIGVDGRDAVSALHLGQRVLQELRRLLGLRLLGRALGGLLVRAVTVDGTMNGWSTRPASFPPLPPVQATVISPPSRAAATPFNTFGELPLVLMAMAMSPF